MSTSVEKRKSGCQRIINQRQHLCGWRDVRVAILSKPHVFQHHVVWIVLGGMREIDVKKALDLSVDPRVAQSYIAL